MAYEKHLLSMKDNDQTANLAALIDAGVRSFKIEGRYKDMSYVKNITAHYRQMLDAIIDDRGDWPAPRRGVPNTSLFRQRIRPSIAAAPTILSTRAKVILARLTRRSLLVCRWGSPESR